MHYKNMGRKAAALKLLALTSTALVGLTLPMSAQAQDWTGATSGNWFNGTNWSTGNVPTAADNVKIENGPGSIPYISGPLHNGIANKVTVGDTNTGINGAQLNIQDGGTLSNVSGVIGNLAGSIGAVDVGGISNVGNYAWWNMSGTLTIGNAGEGYLAIGQGEVSNTDGTIGALAGSNGTVVLNGPSALWINTGTLTVGDKGTGTLNVFNGGNVSSKIGHIGDLAGSTGAVTVNGANSTWTNSASLVVGSAGTGTLNILNGGLVSNTFGVIGYANGSSGYVTVKESGSKWTNTLLYVGAAGTGAMDVLNGGAVSNIQGFVGLNIGGSGTATVSGVGSTWTNSADLNVGYNGSGAVNIKNGGVVSSAEGVIGRFAGSTGVVMVDGTGSKWTSTGLLLVGDEGVGTLNIGHGGKVQDFVGALAVGASTATGHVTVDGMGSNWVNDGGTIIGVTGKGRLDITNGGKVDSGVSVVNADATIGSTAGSTGNVFVDGAGSTWNVNYGLLVGFSGTGTLDITHGGAVMSGNGTLGVNAGSSGIVTVDGVGSRWINTGNLAVGGKGAGAVTIQNGGQVSSTHGYLGQEVGSTASMTVNGMGSIWANISDLTVGDKGIGTLTLSSGGAVDVGGALTIAKTAGSFGDLNIGNGSAAGILIAPNIQFGAGTGTITFNHTNSNYAFNSAISGLGKINQTQGVTRLTANSGGFTGPTNITGGTLLVDGKIGIGAVDVQSSGTLGGKGTIGGTVTIDAGGILNGIQGQTLTMQNLNLGGGANVNVTLSSPGGAELFHIVNDLTLDGTLNITSGGAFGPGVYGLMAYGGSLTDNGLLIGTTPFGSTAADYGVQTSVAGKVNLVNSALANLPFWDGDAPGNANNNIVDGGTGIWTATSTNWTGMNGSTNSKQHPQPTFAIFQGAAGTVTVDASAGPISVTGMQFATDGYQVTGDPITLADPNSIIRVGDGSAVGANYKATIGSVLTGSGGLNKTDLGTLILTADNTYTGGTIITGGTLQLGNGGTSGSVLGNIDNNGVLSFNRSDVTTFAGAISGSGKIRQDGTGTINLTGQSSGFSGDVFANSGTLGVTSGGVLNSSGVFAAWNPGSTAAIAVGGAGSTLNSAGYVAIGVGGDATLSITSGGKVSGDNGFLGTNSGSTGTATISGAGSAWTNSSGLFVGVDGTGSLNIQSAGVVSDAFANIANGPGSKGDVTVTGAGTNWVNTGNLSVGLSGTGTLAITNGGTVSNQIGNIGGFAGANGSVTVDGAGSKWVNGGSVVVGHGGTGTLTIANGGAVSTAGIVLIAGQAGSIGTLNIGSAAGSAAKAAGTLNAAMVEFGQGTGTLNFNHTDTSYTFASSMLGAGTINQFSGSTNLTDDSSGFTGAVNVTGGRLVVNGLLGGGQITVSNGGTLGGNGMIGSLAANTGSIIAPGNSIGTLNVAGNIAFNAGSIYQVEVNAAGQSDKIVAGGTATINGGSVQALAGSGNYASATTYTILTANGGRTGTFTEGVTSNLAFLDPSLSYDPNNVYLTMTRNNIDFAGVGTTPNQIATGGGVETLGFGNPIYNAVLNLSAPQAQYAFNQLSGEIHASAKTAMIEDSRFLRSAVNDRLRAAFGDVDASDGNVVTYDGGKPRAVAANTDGGAVWGQAFGSLGHWNSDGNAAKFDRSIGGFFMGTDAPAFDTWRFGAVAGYSRTSFNAKDRHSSGTSDNYSGGLYGGTQWGDLAFRTGTTYTLSDINTSRRVNFAGFGDSLSGYYRAGTTQVFGELSYKMQAGNVALEPFANLAYVNLHTDGFSEKGGVAALMSQSTSTDATFTTLGLRPSTGFDLNGMAVTAKGMIGWRQVFGDTTPNSVMSFAGSALFSIGGVPIAKNAAVVDLGLDMRLSTNTTLGVSYGGQFGSGVTDQTLRANFNVKF